ncbi:MAG: response regulator [Acidobacteria bacterium]|nr:MAG: response regulator [Acidobacteriota bacterium]PYY21921.1 MAG: response regulator [Acidobacteriota bacterium]
MFRALVVDDESSILGLLRTVLELAAFHVETATSAKLATTLLAQDSFEVVLTDIRMETPTAGFDVIRAARKLQSRPAIAILTAHPISPAEWKPSGADALFIKGSDLINLPDKLKTLMKQRAQRETASEPVLRRSVNQ